MSHPIPTPAEILAPGEELSHRLAYHLGILSALATSIPKTGESKTKGLLDARGWQTNVWNIANNQGFVLGADGVTLVVFGGTNDSRDWLRNARALFPSPHSIGGNTHRGFNQVLEQGLDQALNLPADPDSTRLYVTGHSLGGALATGLAAHLHGTGSPWAARARVVVFGTPRFGNRAFEQAYQSRMPARHFFYANSRDPITKLPTNFMGYRHVGKLIYFNRDNVLTTPPPDSVGLQNKNPNELNVDEAARLEWIAERKSMPRVVSDDDFGRLVDEVFADVKAVPDRMSVTADGSLEIAPAGPELQGAIGGWIAARHSMALYIENIFSTL